MTTSPFGHYCFKNIKNEISIDQLFHDISSLDFHWEHPKENIRCWGILLQRKYQLLADKYSNEIKALQCLFDEKDIDETMYWKYLQGG